MDQKWDERGLIHVSPLQVVAADNVVELIAKVAVAIVEVDVKDELGEREKPDQEHGVADAVTVWGGERRWLCRHGESRIFEINSSDYQS